MADASDKIVKGSQVTHIGSGTSLAAGAVMPSSDVSVALSGTGNLSSYPRCDVAIMIAPTASIASTSTNLYLYRRDLNFDGTNDAPIPGASNRNKFVGVVQASAATTVSTTQYLQITDVELPGAGDCEFYMENGLGVNIPAGWTMKITPKTDVGATT